MMFDATLEKEEREQLFETGEQFSVQYAQNGHIYERTYSDFDAMDEGMMKIAEKTGLKWYEPFRINPDGTLKMTIGIIRTDEDL